MHDLFSEAVRDCRLAVMTKITPMRYLHPSECIQDALHMTTHRIIRYLVATLALGLTLFVLNILFFAKPLYTLYADLCQLGQAYQGETRALMYNRYLFTIIVPCSFLLGGALTWLLMTHRWVALVSATLLLIAIFLAVAGVRR
ncbi:hypothetical protein ACFPTX_01825 [Pseudomonas sp. GCM10022188]|uniref:hypothetical protein n=1 Tax=Pseudomonas TaxID=286 RepID=UPI001E2C6C80|nr:hypothetical protein [Pseudomonas oryzagri]MCC6075342.1 hypothetical protein [Pseudomonas oryzagri]